MSGRQTTATAHKAATAGVSAAARQLARVREVVSLGVAVCRGLRSSSYAVIALSALRVLTAGGGRYVNIRRIRGKVLRACFRDEELVPRMRIIARAVRRYIRLYGVRPAFGNAIYRREDLERLMYRIAAEALYSAT